VSFRRACPLALLLLTGGALGDDEAALYFLGRARDAIAAGDLDRASELLEKSAKEKEGYPPTLLAIADVANRRGERETAIRFLDAVLEQAARPDLSASEREAIGAAEKMLAELDRARAEYRKLVADHVSDVVQLARGTKDPALAKECWRVVLLLDPQNPAAREGLEPPKAEVPGGKPANGTPLFNGKNMNGLTRGPDWRVEDGILSGRVENAAIMTRTERSVKGDFTLSCEMRTKEDLGGNPRLGVIFGIKGLYDHFGFWVCDDNLRITRSTAEGQASDLQRTTFKRFSEKYDRKDWHVYRIQVEGKRIACSVDGEEVFEFNGPDRELDGPVGFFVQEQEAEIRWFILEQDK
jgi:tetratricopeptide (TPR) repeat protein